MKTVALITLGCAKNLVDSEVMHGYLLRDGFDFVSEPEEADIIIINTCGFIRPAKEEATRAIREAVSIKRKNKTLRLVITGCFVQRYQESLKKIYPEVDAWLGIKDFDRIVDAVRGKSFLSREKTFLYSHTSPRSISTPSGWAYIKISEGCSHLCSFCSIPQIKGQYRSRSISSLLAEAESLARSGIKEINLISQDTTYFGRDRGMKDGLSCLLQELVLLRGIEWIRILYGYPEEITDALLEVMKEMKICPYLDIPFQHANPRILKKMKRGMSGEKALKFIEKIRKRIPRIALRTSLIVGFPGEGQKEFADLLRFVREARFDHLGVFVYSQEEQTTSFSLGDPIPEDVKQRRRDKVMEIQAEISAENIRKYVGQKMDVLIESWSNESSTQSIGRSQFQAPEVDGVVLVHHPQDAEAPFHPIQKVEILSSDVYDLHGKIVQ
ncbi:MAG: 30S ribosomal protein S12 methylthiotransferase RimO [Candidatus Aminicenantales bacterium]